MGSRRNISLDDETERLLERYDDNVSELFRRLTKTYYNTPGAGKRTILQLEREELLEEREWRKKRRENDLRAIEDINERLDELDELLQEPPEEEDEVDPAWHSAAEAIGEGPDADPTNPAVQTHASKVGVSPETMAQFLEAYRDGMDVEEAAQNAL